MGFEHPGSTGEFWNPQKTVDFLVGYVDAPTLFTGLRAQEWLDQYVMYGDDGVLDIELTAEKIEIPVSRSLPAIEDNHQFGLLGMTRGLFEGSVEQPGMYLNSYAADHHAVTYGHELGHVLLSVAGLSEDFQAAPKIEAFCDYFGMQVALPVERLADVHEVSSDVIASLMDKFGTNLDMTIYQLMKASKLLTHILMDTSLPDTRSSLYSGKIERKALCYDCGLGNKHAVEEMFADAPVLNATAYEWSFSIKAIDCGRQNTTRTADDNFVALNKHYGRWTAEDDQILEEKKSSRGDSQ